MASWMRHPSSAGHEEPRANLGGPSPKAKYYLATESELVPRGKGEKHPGEGSEIVPETLSLQTVEGLWPLAREATPDRVPFA